MARALIITDEVREALQDLREKAAKDPVDVKVLLETISDPAVKARHMQKMDSLSVMIPTDFMVTFSIETGHGAGACRHMSISVPEENRRPTPEAAWMVARELGFVGGEDWRDGFKLCVVYDEKLTQGGAINIVQPINVVEPKEPKQ